MSEQTVLVQSVELKEGVSQKTGKPYRRVILTDGNGNQHSSFEIGMYEIAKQHEGKQAVIDCVPNGKFSDLLSVKAYESDDPKDKLGTGDYVRGQTAPADKKSIHASVALKEAVATFADTPHQHPVGDVYKRISSLADLYFVWLQRKSGFQLDDDDIPF